MGPMSSGVAAVLAVITLASCAESAAPQGVREFTGPGVTVRVAPLNLAAIGDVVWDLEVANGGSQIVWQRRVSSSAYGDGAGAASYLGPCDADPDVSSNIVRVWLVGVYPDPVAAVDLGSFAAGAPTGVSATALPIASPTAGGALARTVTCLPDADAAVDFDVTVSRAAEQGFFDVAVSFNDLFCSAKYDCCYDTGDGVCAGDGTEDIGLLFDATGARGRTHVLGFACTAGAAEDVTTRLYLDDLAIDCTDPYGTPFEADLVVHTGPAEGGNQCPAGAVSGCAAVTDVGVGADTRLFQVAVFRGVEQLTSAGVAAQKAYWNVALGVKDVSGCRLKARGTADDSADAGDGMANGAVAAGAVYPFVQWDVNLGSCASEGLTFGGGGAVAPAYTSATGGPVPFTSFYDAVTGSGGTCAPACQNGGSCVGGACQCLQGYSGTSCELLDSPLTLAPLDAVVSVSGTLQFTAAGGAGGYVYSVDSGGGSVGAGSGVYSAPAGLDTAVVRVTDAAGNHAETTVSVCADATVTGAQTLPPGEYCYGALAVSSGATLTLDGDAVSGAGVTIRAGTMTVAVGGAISSDGRGYGAGLGPGAGSGSSQTAANEASSGGGHGGAGGSAACGGPAGGGINGSPLAPTTAGSGGDTSEALAGGRGGGAVRIIVTGALSLGGTIRSNGATGQSNGNKASGGGAGGSVWIDAGTLSGSGGVAARGGNGVMSGYGCWAGGGGGGRIAVYADVNTSSVTYDLAPGGGNQPGASGTLAYAYAGVLTLWNFATTFAQDTTWTGLVVSSNASASIAVGVTLSLDFATLTGALTNNGTLAVADAITLSGGGSYAHGATASLDAAGATLAVGSGTGYWNVSTAAVEAPTVAALSVPAGTVLSHAANATTYARRLWLTVLGDATVAGAIDVSAKGYAAASGPGAGGSNATINQTASGGGHGGAGANAKLCTGPVGGPANGDPMVPQGLGSGGGNSGSYVGGHGGGEVHLTVAGVLTVSGAIRADGESGSYNNNYASGGGAGGTVWVDVATLAGAGAFGARGGSSVQSVYGCQSGAGGGGRVAVTAGASTFSGSYDLATGGGPSPGAAGTRMLAYAGALNIWNFGLSVTAAASWTILTVSSNASVTVSSGGDVTVDTLNLYGVLTNAGTMAVATSFVLSGAGRYHHVVGAVLDADTAALTVPSGTVSWDVAPAVAPYPRVASATIASGATLTHTANGATHVYALLLETVGDLTVSGAINVASKGYAAGAGPGAGITDTTLNKAASGAGHGGTGGPASLCTTWAGGAANDSAALPVAPGSGGGNSASPYFGGAGGGVVGLTVGGTLTLAGSITADGGVNSTNNNYASGGGAGGSVWIGAETLSGAGSISARGGNAARSVYGCRAGAGGGGRIAIYPTTNASTVSTIVVGGTGDSATNNGGGGTVVF